MQIRSQVVWLPKAGCALEEYEDAFWPAESVDQSAGAYSFAVADGATEASFSGLWAQLLVRGWCRGWLSEKTLRRRLPWLQQEWLRVVGGRPLPWYAEMKLAEGAFAALLGLRLRANGEDFGSWSAMTVGDCLLLQVREEKLLVSFPYTDHTLFGICPRLIGSRPELLDKAADARVFAGGEWKSGDLFYLMTDALAAWVLSNAQALEHPWAILDSAMGEGNFAGLVSQLRESRQIRNDDVTVIRVQLA